MCHLRKVKEARVAINQVGKEQKTVRSKLTELSHWNLFAGQKRPPGYRVVQFCSSEVS